MSLDKSDLSILVSQKGTESNKKFKKNYNIFKNSQCKVKRTETGKVKDWKTNWLVR